jgi:hypothetical protein
MAGEAELSHEEDVERRSQSPGYLEADWNASARQGEHQNIGATLESLEVLRQLDAGVVAVAVRFTSADWFWSHDLGIDWLQ